MDLAVRTLQRYSEDDAGSYAAALTYYTFFAIFPLLLFGAAILGYLTFGNQELKADIFDAAVDAVPLIRSSLRSDVLDVIEANRRTIALTGIALAFYTGTGVIVALGHALDRIYRCEDEGNFIQKRVRALRWLLTLGLAAVGSLILTGLAGWLDAPIAKIVSYLGGFTVNVFIFTTAFKFLPAKRLSWGDVWVGAVMAAVGFELVKVLGAVYLTRGASARAEAFGTLAGAATLLVAAYLISQVTLLAAEVNAAIAERRATRAQQVIGDGEAR
ncbi:MAG: YihY/virulence factor BrkB family protein [Actinomycetota bacterium]|nr:YihY/virulence factor BrkB family protein [Actinomycetota bacterium]